MFSVSFIAIQSLSLFTKSYNSLLFLYKKILMVKFSSEKDANCYFFGQKSYKSLLFPANRCESLLFRTKQLGIFVFSYKKEWFINDSQFVCRNCPIYHVIRRKLFNRQPCTVTLDCWSTEITGTLDSQSSGELFSRRPCTMPLDCWSTEITGTLDSQSAESTDQRTSWS